MWNWIDSGNSWMAIFETEDGTRKQRKCCLPILNWYRPRFGGRQNLIVHTQAGKIIKIFHPARFYHCWDALQYFRGIPTLDNHGINLWIESYFDLYVESLVMYILLNHFWFFLQRRFYQKSTSRVMMNHSGPLRGNCCSWQEANVPVAWLSCLLIVCYCCW